MEVHRPSGPVLALTTPGPYESIYKTQLTYQYNGRAERPTIVAWED